jgi:hypothetical protein
MSVRVRVSYGAYAGPVWIHWLTWTYSWSFWIAVGTNSNKSHASSEWAQAAIKLLLGEKFALVIDCLCKLYPELAGEIRAGCNLIIDSTVYPGSDCAGNVVKTGTAIRPVHYQLLKRFEYIDFPQVPDSCLTGFLKRCGTGYWWWGLFRLLIPKWMRPAPPKDWRSGEAFCDELIFVVAEEAGAPLLNPDENPCDALPEYLNILPEGVHHGENVTP